MTDLKNITIGRFMKVMGACNVPRPLLRYKYSRAWKFLYDKMPEDYPYYSCWQREVARFLYFCNVKTYDIFDHKEQWSVVKEQLEKSYDWQRKYNAS